MAGAPWGHGGATHSLTVAVAGGVAVGLGARLFKRPFARTALVATLVLASHGLLDAMTDGGLGAALFWPFTRLHGARFPSRPSCPSRRDTIQPRGRTR